MPDQIESIAELMLFDSTINVYEEANVNVNLQEFDFRARVNKP